MDAATITMLEAAFSLAKGILDIVGNRPGLEKTNERASQVENFLTSSVAKLEVAVHDAAQLVIEKLESDKLEELLSRTRNCAMLVNLNKQDQALQYSLTLRESVDYARNRVQEGKPHWLGPYIGGFAVFLAALEYSGQCPESEIAEFKALVTRTKLEILDASAPVILASNRTLPWMEIANFLEGDATHLPSGIVAAFGQREKTKVRATNVRSGKQSKTAKAAQKYFKNLDMVYLAPKIPQKKIDGASKQLIPSTARADELLCLIDTTVFGSAVDGVAIFEDYLVYADFGDVQRYSYGELGDPPAEKSWQSVKAGGKKLTLYNADLAEAFAAFLHSVSEK